MLRYCQAVRIGKRSPVVDSFLYLAKLIQFVKLKKKKSRMAVGKIQRREKHAKIEQRKV